MALNPIAFTERVVDDFLQHPLTTPRGGSGGRRAGGGRLAATRRPWEVEYPYDLLAKSQTCR